MKKTGFIIRFSVYLVILFAAIAYAGMNDRFSPVDLNSDGSITGATSITASGAISGSSTTLSGLTANRVLRTNGSKVLTSNAALTSGGLLIADTSGFPSTDPSLNYTLATDTLGAYKIVVEASVNAVTITASGDVSGNSVHGSSIVSSGTVTGTTITASGDVSGNSVHASSVVSSGTITGSGDVSGNSVHGSTVTASGDVSGNSVHASSVVSSGTVTGTTITASGDVSGNSVHASTGTFSNLTANRVAKTTTGGQLTPSTVTDASFEAAIAPILVDASGTGGTTLTQTMFQSYSCQFDNYSQGASDASTVLPLAARNLSCQGVVTTAQANKWGVQDTTCTMTLIDASGATQAGPYCYVLFDNAVAGQSFDVWTQKYDATTYRWFVRARLIGAGRSFTGTP